MVDATSSRKVFLNFFSFWVAVEVLASLNFKIFSSDFYLFTLFISNDHWTVFIFQFLSSFLVYCICVFCGRPVCVAVSCSFLFLFWCRLLFAFHSSVQFRQTGLTWADSSDPRLTATGQNEYKVFLCENYSKLSNKVI